MNAKNKNEVKDITVTIIWDGSSLDEVLVRLYANGRFMKKERLTEADGWFLVFRDVPKYAKDGSEIEYSVIEDKLSGYIQEITRIRGEFSIINIKEEEGSPYV